MVSTRSVHGRYTESASKKKIKEVRNFVSVFARACGFRQRNGPCLECFSDVVAKMKSVAKLCRCMGVCGGFVGEVFRRVRREEGGRGER